MTLEVLRVFFMWCTILGGGLLVLFVLLFMLLRNFLHEVFGDMFGLRREQFNVASFCLLGFMEIMFWMLFVVPYLALVILS